MNLTPLDVFHTALKGYKRKWWLTEVPGGVLLVYRWEAQLLRTMGLVYQRGGYAYLEGNSEVYPMPYHNPDMNDDDP